MKTRFLGVVLFFVVLSGCAGRLPLKGAKLQDATVAPVSANDGAGSSPASPSQGFIEKDKNGGYKIDMLIEPYESLGFLKTPAMVREDVTVAKWEFPDRLTGEYFPGRIRWNIWAVDEDRKEFFGQTAFTGLTSYAGPFLHNLVIDGTSNKKMKAVLLPTCVDFAYNSAAKEIQFDPKKFQKDPEYRWKIIWDQGSEVVHDPKLKEEMLQILSNWNPYDSPKGTIISPLGEDQIKEMAKINPQYAFAEKLVARGKFALTIDYIGTGASFIIDCIVAANAPSTGWDYRSELPSRRVMGLITEALLHLKQKRIDFLNATNAQLATGQIPVVAKPQIQEHVPASAATSTTTTSKGGTNRGRERRWE